MDNVSLRMVYNLLCLLCLINKSCDVTTCIDDTCE